MPNDPVAEEKPRPTLTELLEKARTHTMTPEEKEAQRQSWVRGEMAMSEVTQVEQERAARFVDAEITRHRFRAGEMGLQENIESNDHFAAELVRGVQAMNAARATIPVCVDGEVWDVTAVLRAGSTASPAAGETQVGAPHFWKYHHDLLQRELKTARNLLGKCAGAMECLPCTPTYINLAKEARELLARAEVGAPQIDVGGSDAFHDWPREVGAQPPACPHCGKRDLRIIVNKAGKMFVFCPTSGCFTYPVDTSESRGSSPAPSTPEIDWLTIAAMICLKTDIEEDGEEVMPSVLAKFMADTHAQLQAGAATGEGAQRRPNGMNSVEKVGHVEETKVDKVDVAVVPSGGAPPMSAEQLAQKFHEAYERLAPQFGYETRKESAKPWSEVPENNRKLMTAVCAEILADAASSNAPLNEQLQILAQNCADHANQAGKFALEILRLKGELRETKEELEATKGSLGDALHKVGDLQQKLADSEAWGKAVTRSGNTLASLVSTLKGELGEERQAHEKIAEYLLPLVGTGDGTSVDAAKKAAGRIGRLEGELREARQQAEAHKQVSETLRHEVSKAAQNASDLQEKLDDKIQWQVDHDSSG